MGIHVTPTLRPMALTPMGRACFRPYRPPLLPLRLYVASGMDVT
jgi:hypothetical protein